MPTPISVISVSRRLLEADLVQQSCVRAKVSGQSMTPLLGHLIAEKDVFGDRQQRHQRQFLVDDDDAEMFAVGDAREAALLALEMDLAVIGAVRIDAAQHLHQRRFAGAVFADNAWISPARDRRLTLSSAFTPGNVLVMPRISRMVLSMFRYSAASEMHRRWSAELLPAMARKRRGLRIERHS